MAKVKKPQSAATLKCLNIGNLIWNIVPIADRDESVQGLCSTPDDHWIAIRMEKYDDPKGEHLDTTWHEILHVICNMSLTASHHLSEQQITVLAMQLEKICIENPHFIRWLSDYSAWLRQHQ